MAIRAKNGIALITTLIMLAVVTLMAVVFLSISRRERASVVVSEDQTTSRVMADIGVARAQAAIMARMLVRTNLFNYDLMVSTNFYNPRGFTPNARDTTNVNYDYRITGIPLVSIDWPLNIANLKYDPRPPVFIPTNSLGSNEFRFYLDLNRNGRFETNGLLPVLDQTGRPVVGGQRSNLVDVFVGDPEWIGVLERPDLPHSGSNRFIGRFAYLVLPAGKSLDLNFLHNQAKLTKSTGQQIGEGFIRNQGVGSWEINLAGFFRDLNTNVWPIYKFYPDLGLASVGSAFNDAYTFLSNRYNGTHQNLDTVTKAFGARGQNAISRDGIDDYSNDPVTTAGTAPDDDDPNKPWPGSDNPKGYFDVQELFTLPNTVPGLRSFTTALMQAGRSNSFYDRYTFYRLLGQAGMDSAPALAGKFNINYATDAAGYATNFVDWRPVTFFTNAAERLLRSQFNFGVTNIPVWPTNFYLPSVHRALQLAANIIDATTNRTQTGYPYLPSVFRPMLRTIGTNVFIVGYTEVTETADVLLARPWRDLNNPTDRQRITVGDLVYGIPLVIGAKKGFPNFNEFAVQTSVQLTRKLKLHKDSLYGMPTQTNQMYILGISNRFGIEAWNSYTQAFPRALEMRVTNYFSMVLTNQLTGGQLYGWRSTSSSFSNIAPGTWIGQQFILPILTNQVVLTNSAFKYAPAPAHFEIVTTNTAFDDIAGRAPPRWGMIMTNRPLYILIDAATRRIVDVANPGDLVSAMNVTDELINPRDNPPDSRFWDASGIFNQITASLSDSTDWNNYTSQSPQGEDKRKAIARFRVFLNMEPIYYPREQVLSTNFDTQAPFTPTRNLASTVSWQANDPLVHYTAADLTNLQRTNDIQFVRPPDRAPTNSNLGRINDRYSPWGGNPTKTQDSNSFNLTIKDPLVRRSDDWEFPTNKFPNIGWLGRVHRGTPWQTVYLKSDAAPAVDWARWSGDRFALTHPTNDWRIVQLFTVALNGNAASGLLSVNQTNIAAWSAVLSGVRVLSNSIPDADVLRSSTAQFTNVVIEPNSPQLQRIVGAINRTRNTLLAFDQRFPDLGTLLATRELTVLSPYLNFAGAQPQAGLNDAAYERIPQQILSLLKEDEPRVVIYAWGQSLKPADRSLVLSPGPYFQMCTNYQITGEFATKSVVRFEKPLNQPLRPVVEGFNILPND
jgi:hypothetical protein